MMGRENARFYKTDHTAYTDGTYERKTIVQITVKEIVGTLVGVNRNTFYYHFRDIPDAVEAMVKEELNDILKDQKAPESVSDCMEILVNAVQKNKKAMIHLYRSIQRDVFADYLDHATERVVEELINRRSGTLKWIRRIGIL